MRYVVYKCDICKLYNAREHTFQIRRYIPTTTGQYDFVTIDLCDKCYKNIKSQIYYYIKTHKNVKEYEATYSVLKERNLVTCLD